MTPAEHALLTEARAGSSKLDRILEHLTFVRHTAGLAEKLALDASRNAHRRIVAWIDTAELKTGIDADPLIRDIRLESIRALDAIELISKKHTE